MILRRMRSAVDNWITVRVMISLSLVVSLCLISIPPVIIHALGPPICQFWGTAQLDGANVPDGTEIASWVDGAGPWTTTTPAQGGDHSTYLMIVPTDNPSTPAKDGANAGDIVYFSVGGCSATQTHVWQEGGIINLDLLAISGPSVILITAPPAFTRNNSPYLEGTSTVQDSTVASAAYRIDGGTWIPANSVDGAYDEPSEDFNFTTAALSEGTHTIQVKASDALGRSTPPSAYATTSFTIDNTIPTVTLNNLGEFTNTPGILDGTAADAPPGEVDGVQLTIHNTSSNSYWDGGSWSSTQTWLNATGTSTWSYTMPPLTDGEYSITAKCYDVAGHESSPASDSFNFDTVPPTVIINDIPDFAGSLSSISGTAVDMPPGQVDKVQVAIMNATDNRYWDGTSAWITNQTWLDTDGTASWSYTMPSLTNNKSYSIKAKALDKAGNWSNQALESFVVDTAIPTVSINDIPDFVSSLPSIDGTAIDTPPGEIDVIRITIHNTSDSTYWTGSSWASAETWVDASGKSNWSYAMPSLAEANHTVRAKSVDGARNQSTTTSDSFTYDITAPTVTINNIPGFVNTPPPLGGTAGDNGEVDQVQVAIKNTTDNRSWNGSSWTPSSTDIWLNTMGTSDWIYSMPHLNNGRTYTIKAKGTDKAGTESAIVTVSFTCDIQAPTTTITDVPNFVNTLTSVDGTATDSPPGQVEKVQVSIKNTTDSTYWDGGSWIASPSDVWLEAVGSTSWSYALPPLPDANYTVKARSIDMAGNVSSANADSFRVDITPPMVTINDIPEFVKTLPTIHGTASDPSPGLLEKVQILLNNSSDNTYWDGSSWKSSETWLKANGALNWSYTLPSLATGHYTVKAKASDKAGNEGATLADSFILDNTAPTISMDDIPAYVDDLPHITGTAFDTPPGEIEKVQVLVRNSSNQ